MASNPNSTHPTDSNVQNSFPSNSNTVSDLNQLYGDFGLSGAPAKPVVKVTPDELRQFGNQLMALTPKIDTAIQNISNNKVLAGLFPEATKIADLISNSDSSRGAQLMSDLKSLESALTKLAGALIETANRYQSVDDLNSYLVSNIDTMVHNVEAWLPSSSSPSQPAGGSGN
ncbi:hypothetical protein [Kitasatospora sp. NPDC093102]|uniref:hypothetical protein n=1 Tax=Kitasatospora sp. NPDC093102 TaxID=3155069 RepID=UPI00343BC436